VELDESEMKTLRRFRLNEQDAERLKNLQYLTFQFSEGVESVPAEVIAPLCKLRGLKILQLGCRLLGLPACIGEMKALTHLDVRGNHFGHGPLAGVFPASMAKLVNLVEFVGFEQGRMEYTGPSSPCTIGTTCVPTFETLASATEVDDPSANWKCQPLRAHLNDLPFFSFGRLEKFWWDMNELQLRPGFFAKAARSWPSLRSLDLYDNNITCDVREIAALKRLPQMQQLLLQGNRVYGELRSSFFKDWPATWSLMDLSMNPELEGCLHPEDLPKPLFFKYFGTRVTVSHFCEHEGEPEEEEEGEEGGTQGVEEN